jgi:hypothetical protein
MPERSGRQGRERSDSNSYLFLSPCPVYFVEELKADFSFIPDLRRKKRIPGLNKAFVLD